MASRIALFALLSTALFFSPAFFNPGKNHSLLIAEFDPKAGSNQIQHLFAYRFQDGKFSGKEKLLSVSGMKDPQKGTYVRFDLGNCRIYKNRYVITGIGNVIDVLEKKVILDQRDKFIKAHGDSLIFYTNDIFKGKYYSVLKLKTGEYAPVQDLLFKAIPGKDIEVDYSTRQFKIYLYPQGASKVLLVPDAGYGEDPSARKEKSVQTPFVWLDNTYFVFPHYSQSRDFCTLYKVNAETKAQEKIGEIDNIPSVAFNSFFMYDSKENLVYVCGKGNFIVDWSGFSGRCGRKTGAGTNLPVSGC
jgi:hypothetical protein